jgi:hypothetical protein
MKLTQEELDREREALAEVGKIDGKISKEDNIAWDDLWYELLAVAPTLSNTH